MDDIRRPQEFERRDYSTPQHRPAPSAPRQIPISEPSVQTQPQQPAPQYQPAPVTHQPPSQVQPRYQEPSYQQFEESAYHRPPVQEEPVYAQPAAQPAPLHPQAPAETKKKRGVKPLIIAVSGIFAISLFGAGYLYKSSGSADGIPNKIIKQVDYTLYFPSPMPAGYTYMKDTATFQIGQVYFKFSDGKKRVTVKEEPMTDPKPNLDLLQGYEKMDTPFGKAAVGMTFGHPTAIVVTHSTVITMNTIGGVTKDELKTAISNLQNIGQNSDRGK